MTVNQNSSSRPPKLSWKSQLKERSKASIGMCKQTKEEGRMEPYSTGIILADIQKPLQNRRACQKEFISEGLHNSGPVIEIK